jgi:hypothetical protein
MKLSEAAGFLFVGAVMLGLPRWAPGLCPRNGFDGTSGRELWLQVMGILQTGLGAGVLLRSLAGAMLTSLLAWPETLAELWGRLLPEPETDLAELEDATFRGAEVVAVDFAAKPAWEDQRAA